MSQKKYYKKNYKNNNHRRKPVSHQKKDRVELPVYVGKYMATTRGFGFVGVDELDEDIFIPEKHIGGAMDGDIVRVVVTKIRSGRRAYEGEIEKVVSRKTTSIVGTFDKSSKFTFVIPDNSKFADIYIPKGKTKGAKDGQKVFVEITEYPKKDKSAEGEVTKVLGFMDEPGVDVLSVIRGMELPEEFPDDVRKQAKKLPSKVSKKERRGRRDFRKLLTVTIDGEDTKDYDDAITLAKDGTGYILGVHIADVAHYVTEGTPLDREARERGTSIYLADRVIPMLPKKLSNGICSLNAGEDRLTLSCVMKIDADGHIESHEIVESVINVDERMTYGNVSELIDIATQAGVNTAKCAKHVDDKGGIRSKKRRVAMKKTASLRGNRTAVLYKKYKKIIGFFCLMEELALKMRAIREKQGSIDFDLPESKIELDASGKTVSIKQYDRNEATRIIEEFMLAANRTVAEEAYWLEIPFLYRCHDEPEAEKIKDLARVTSYFGHTMKIGQDGIHPKTLRTMLDAISGRPEEQFISMLALRAMARAEYRTSCDGHFGLAEKYYTHFTSPIRRYPDLQIHRILKKYMHGSLDDDAMNELGKSLPKTAKLASERERRADDAEREVERLKKAAYMEDHIGEEYEGIISGVTAWGIYVALPNTIEGMVRIHDMTDDRYEYEEKKFRVVGHRNRREFRLGDTVRVQVLRVDKVMRTIDFLMLGD